MANPSKIMLDSDLERNATMYRLSKMVCRRLFPVFLRHKIIGMENIPPDGPAILASKHTCWFDLVVTGCFIDRMVYTFAKSSFFDTSTSLRRARRWWVKKMGGFNINRKEDDIGIRPSDIDRMLRPLDEGSLLLLYPEGTRVKGGVGQPKKGLAAAVRFQAARNPDVNLPIIPLSPAYSQLPFASVKSCVPFWERATVSLVAGRPIYYGGEPVREFTAVLKERLVDCYSVAKGLVGR